MKIRHTFSPVALGALLLVSCMHDDDAPTQTHARHTTSTNGSEQASADTHGTEAPRPEQSNRSSALPIAPDDGSNVEPASPPPTAQDQSESQADLDISASIRRSLVNDGSLSMMAQNVTIVTRAGVVTLRGDVNTAAERAAIERHARSTRGVTRVDNLIVAER